MWLSFAGNREDVGERFPCVSGSRVLSLAEQSILLRQVSVRPSLSWLGPAETQTNARSVPRSSAAVKAKAHPSSIPSKPIVKSSINIQFHLIPIPSPLNPLPHIIRRRLPLRIPQVLHLVRRHQPPLHATAEVVFAQLAALRRVDAAGGLEAAEVLFHERLAFGVVVEGEGAFCWRVGAANFDAGAGGAEGGHFGGFCRVVVGLLFVFVEGVDVGWSWFQACERAEVE